MTTLKTCIPGGEVNTTFPISLKAFVHLLTKFTEHRKKYNGVRVYFICYPNQKTGEQVHHNPTPDDCKGQLGLLFVPTEPASGPTGKDDPEQYYHLYKDKIMHLPAPKSVPKDEDYVTIWKEHYKESIVPTLRKDGQTCVGPKYDETISLWYSMNSIAGGGGDSGLLAYIKCGECFEPNPIIGLSVEFACFADKSDLTVFPYYQLSLIFDLQQKLDKKGPGLAFGSNALPLRDGPADTGIPCPPESNCPPPAATNKK